MITELDMLFELDDAKDSIDDVIRTGQYGIMQKIRKALNFEEISRVKLEWFRSCGEPRVMVIVTQLKASQETAEIIEKVLDMKCREYETRSSGAQYFFRQRRKHKGE